MRFIKDAGLYLTIVAMIWAITYMLVYAWDAEYEYIDGGGVLRTGEPFDDILGNSVWDGGDAFNDLNGDGKYSLFVDELIELDGLEGPTGEMFIDLDGENDYDAGEPFFDLPDGIFNGGEAYFDLNANGRYDVAEPFEDDVNDPNGLWDQGEPYRDLNGDGSYTYGDSFYDVGNGVYDGSNVNGAPGDRPAIVYGRR